MSDEPRAVAGSGDPGTSWEAARRVQGIRASQAEVLGILRRLGPMTDEQRVGILGTRHPAVPVRDPDPSVRTGPAGEIVDTGRKRVGSTGRRLIVWGIPGEARVRPSRAMLLRSWSGRSHRHASSRPRRRGSSGSSGRARRTST